MIVRLIDRKDFTKVVEHPAGKLAIKIAYPIRFNNLRAMLNKDPKLDPSDSLSWMTTMEFRYTGAQDYDGLPIFEEIDE